MASFAGLHKLFGAEWADSVAGYVFVLVKVKAAHWSILGLVIRVLDDLEFSDYVFGGFFVWVVADSVEFG